MSLPFLVVINITPLAPRAPYNAVAVASFRIENPSITSGERAFKSPIDTSTLSIKTSGDVLLAKVEIPRIQKFAPSAPGSPPRCTATTPAIRPANELLSVLDGERSSLAFTVCTAPTTLAFFWAPNPTTTTSSSCLASGAIFKMTFVLPFKGNSVGVYPIKLATKTVLAGTVRVKLPSISVIVPLVLSPFTTTLAPGTPSSFSSRTFPVTFISFFSCCGASAATLVTVI